MQESDPKVFVFPNNGVVFDRLPSDMYQSLMAKVSASLGNPKSMNHRLVGHLQTEQEFLEGIEIIEDFVLSLAHVHAGYFNHFSNHAVLSKSCELSVNPLWINFQQKHEFNPPHGHEGIYSFVIWMKIPYDLEQEMDVFPARSKMTSMFGFITTDILGKSHVNPIPVNKDYEGVICLFPSTLLHYVNPFFTSDDNRISISGNILFKVDRTEKGKE